MAIGQTNISITLVKNTLGESFTNLSGLCTSNNINKWSRFKPVRGTYPTSTDGKYGLQLPTSTNGSAYSVSNWTYLKPTTEFRLGDFRGYQHTDIMPVVYSKQANNNSPATLYPSGTIYTATYSIKGNNTNNTTRIRTTDLGLYNYYIGLRYKINSGFWYYKTAYLVGDLSDTGGLPLEINVQVTVTEGNATFTDAPTTTTGTAYYELVLCSSQCLNWTQTAPTTVILLPAETINGEVLVNSGSITIADWSFLTDLDMYFQNSNLAYQSSVVYCSSPNWYVVSKPSWISTATYRNGVLVSGVNDYISGDELRIYPNSVNTGDNRSGAVEVSANEVSVFQDGHNPQLISYNVTGFSITGGAAIFSVNDTNCYVNWTTSSGLASRTDIYVRLFDINTAQYLGNWQTVSTINGEYEAVTLTGLTTTDLRFGGDYDVYLTTINPNL